jgi:sensor domain CHASE-containing protein
MYTGVIDTIVLILFIGVVYLILSHKLQSVETKLDNVVKSIEEKVKDTITKGGENNG